MDMHGFTLVYLSIYLSLSISLSLSRSLSLSLSLEVLFRTDLLVFRADLLFCLPVNLQCFCSFRFTTQKVQFSQAIARLGGPKDEGGGPSPELILVQLFEL